MKAVNIGIETATKRVDDPFQKIGERSALLVTINKHEDAIEWLLSRQLITELRYAIACRYRRLHEKASIGSIKAIDYSKPYVSGGQGGDVFTDQLVSSGQEMVELVLAIGQECASFLNQLVGVGTSFQTVAGRYSVAYGMPMREARGYVRGRLAEALDKCGVFWAMVEVRGRDRQTITSAHDQPVVRGGRPKTSRK